MESRPLPPTSITADLDGDGDLDVVDGPVATFRFDVPDFPVLIGVSFNAQAMHIGGVTPFALSNAQDYVIGR